MKDRGDRMKKPLLILTGPTAVGKTAVSIRLAQAVGGEVVSADSMQIYRYMNVGTAKITPEEMAGIPHHLVDEITPDTPFHVYEFKKRAEACMAGIYERGHVPVIVGGTGFYIQALLYDVDFCEEETDRSYRHELERLAAQQGGAYLHDRLREVDAVSAESIHPHNVKRVIRALEYMHETGRPISAHNKEQRQKESPYDFLYFVLTMDRSRLYDRINKRVDQMVERGLAEEFQELIRKGYTKDMISMQAIGYKELFPYLEGKQSFDEAVKQIKTDTRHFAKRQMTWFRRERGVTFLNWEDFSGEEAVVAYILTKCQEKWEDEYGQDHEQGSII